MLSFSMDRQAWETVCRNDIETTGLDRVREFLEV